jgi:hypothetical protein
VDIAHGEHVEKELDLLITAATRSAEPRRARDERRRCGRRERRYTQQRREENRAARCEYHEDQAARMSAVLEALIGYHNVQAQKYRENGHHQEEDSCSSRSTPKSR